MGTQRSEESRRLLLDIDGVQCTPYTRMPAAVMALLLPFFVKLGSLHNNFDFLHHGQFSRRACNSKDVDSRRLEFVSDRRIKFLDRVNGSAIVVPMTVL
jgi:hypothetical protein